MPPRKTLAASTDVLTARRIPARLVQPGLVQSAATDPAALDGLRKPVSSPKRTIRCPARS